MRRRRSGRTARISRASSAGHFQVAVLLGDLLQCFNDAHRTQSSSCRLVQAIGSVGAILVAVWLVRWEHRKATELIQASKDDAAIERELKRKILALRLEPLGRRNRPIARSFRTTSKKFEKISLPLPTASWW